MVTNMLTRPRVRLTGADRQLVHAVKLWAMRLLHILQLQVVGGLPSLKVAASWGGSDKWVEYGNRRRKRIGHGSCHFLALGDHLNDQQAAAVA